MRWAHLGGHNWRWFFAQHTFGNNRNDLIYTMAKREDYPGWGDLLRKGATTFPESWDGGSQLHDSYLYIGRWFIEGLGGIQQPKAGFKHFVIVPLLSSNRDQERPLHIMIRYTVEFQLTGQRMTVGCWTSKLPCRLIPRQSCACTMLHLVPSKKTVSRLPGQWSQSGVQPT